MRKLLQTRTATLIQTLSFIHIKSHAAFINTRPPPHSLISNFWYVSVISAWLYPRVHRHLFAGSYGSRMMSLAQVFFENRRAAVETEPAQVFSCKGPVKRESPARSLRVGGPVWVSSGYRLVSEPPSPPTLSGEEGTWLSPVCILWWNSLAGKTLGKPQRLCLTKTHILFFKALNNQQREREVASQRGLAQEFAWLRKRKEAMDGERKRKTRKTEQKAAMERRREWEMTKRSRWSFSHGRDHMPSSLKTHLSYFKGNNFLPSVPSSSSGVSYSESVPIYYYSTTQGLQVHADTRFDIQATKHSSLGVLSCTLSSADELMRRPVLYHAC